MKKFFLMILIIAAGVVGYYYFPESKIEGEKIVDRIVVKKKDHKMEVYAADELLNTYSISLNKKPEGEESPDAEDRSVPTGEYYIFDKDSRSKYRKSIGFDTLKVTPGAEVVDETTVKKKKKKTGYRIHGMKRGYGFIGKFHRWTDWTKGGIAVTDDEIEDIFKHVEVGAMVIVND